MRKTGFNVCFQIQLVPLHLGAVLDPSAPGTHNPTRRGRSHIPLPVRLADHVHIVYQYTNRPPYGPCNQSSDTRAPLPRSRRAPAGECTKPPPSQPSQRSGPGFARSRSREVGLYELNSLMTHSLKVLWFQPLILKLYFLVSYFAFKCVNLFRYSEARNSRNSPRSWRARTLRRCVWRWSRGRGRHFSPRYFAAKTPIDDSQYGPCNQPANRK